MTTGKLEAVYYSAPVPRSKAAMTVLGLVFDRVHFPSVYLPAETDAKAVTAEISRIANSKSKMTAETAVLLNAMSLVPHLHYLRTFCEFGGMKGQVFGGDLKAADQLAMKLELAVFGPPPENFIPMRLTGHHRGLPGGDYIDYPGEFTYSANALIYSSERGLPLVNDTNLPVLPIAGVGDRFQELAGLLALRCVEFALPVVPPLMPREIAELRDALAPHLQSFRSSVSELAVGLETMLRSDADEDRIEREAEFMVKAKVAPAFAELSAKLTTSKVWTLENAMQGAGTAIATVTAASQSMSLGIASVLAGLGLFGVRLRNEQKELERSGLFYLVKLRERVESRRLR
jgi:hypothetical protein